MERLASPIQQQRGRELKIPSLARNGASSETTRRRPASRRQRRQRAGLGNPLSRFKVVLDRDYARLWGIGVSSNTMRWLETVALGVYVFDLTQSAFLVGFVGFLRMAPMLFLGAFIGALADRLNRRAILAVANIILAAIYLTLALLIVTDRIELWHISLGAFIAGAVWATDFPVRRAMIADIVPPDRVSSAFGVDMASSNFSRVIGPLVGGAFLQEIGMQAVYFLGTALFVVASSLAFSMLIMRKAPSTVVRTPATSSNFDLRPGIRHILGDTVLLVTIIITITMNLFAFPYQQMIPVLGAEKLMVDPVLVGLLLSVEGLGATFGALTIAAVAQPRHYTRIYTYASLSFLVIIAAFALTPYYWLALPLLFIGGFGMSGFGAMQSIIVVSSTRPEMRGRVLGVLAVAIGSGPIGALYIGWLATQIGTDTAVLTIAITGIILTTIPLLIWRRFLRSIPRYRSLDRSHS